MSPNVLVIAGASGSGKSTIVRHILRKYSGLFRASVSYTTRIPREREVNGVDYHFVTQEVFLRKVQAGEFVEHAEYAGNFYGTGKEYSCPGEEKVLLLEIEKKGVQSIKSSGMDAVYMYIYAPMSVLHERISQRAIITQDELSRRLMKAKEENMYGSTSEFDVLVENNLLEEALSKVDDFIERTWKVQRA
ncbi:guanylate kinase [Nematocida major]|uniref:guanylate kinase n=1 Tax=Nematocida major TaxID=1912982 RepID=UPI002007B81C|nr:guanylate kinase [Nematocida major]KAH9386922.1 guanylate kinase [Nematocida major]